MKGMVPARLIQEILNGSYEQMIESLSRAAADHHTVFNAESPEDVHLVATFPHHVIVANEEGEFFRATIKRTDDGNHSFVQIEEFEVPIIKTWEQQQAFVSEAASDAVRALLAGDIEHARNQVRALVRSSDLVVAPDPLAETDQYLSNLFDEDRAWRRVYFENRNHIHRFLWGASGVAFRDAPRPKYAELYHGDGVEEAEQYNLAVQTDLSLLAERLASLWERIAESYGGYDAKMSGFKGVEIAGLAENFETFASDFVKELQSVYSLVEQASKDSDPATVVPRALIYDKVSVKYPDIEIGSKLVQRTAVELA